MASYVEIARSLARRIAEGEIEEGGVLPAMRGQASASPATAQHAYRELADAEVIHTEPRRVARVAPGGRAAAARYLAGGTVLTLSTTDDPGVRLLVAAGAAVLVAAHGDGAALALQHVDGRWNDPFAHALYGADAVTVVLWDREVGLIVAPGNPRRIVDVSTLAGRRVVREPLGAGNRSRLDALLDRAGIGLDATDPEAPGELAASIAVASGSADVAFGCRAIARSLQLGFVPVGWEPVVLAGAAPNAEALAALALAAQREPLRARIEALGGYAIRSV